MADFQTAIQEEDAPEALEAARALIDRIIVSPPNDDGPPEIELIGQLAAMLGTAGLGSAKDDRANTPSVLGMVR